MLCPFFWVNWFELLLKNNTFLFLLLSLFVLRFIWIYLEDLDFTNVTFQSDIYGINLCLAMYCIAKVFY